MLCKETKRVKVNGKYYTLPLVFYFGPEALTAFHNTYTYFYDVVGFHHPKKGEWFVSGAMPIAYQAPNDLRVKYIIVVPTDKAKQIPRWEKVYYHFSR